VFGLRLITTDAGVQAKGIPLGIRLKKVTVGQVPSRVLLFPLYVVIPPVEAAFSHRPNVNRPKLHTRL
jgi:hypothetical protein